MTFKPALVKIVLPEDLLIELKKIYKKIPVTDSIYVSPARGISPDNLIQASVSS
jgi:hypothetical protein